MLDLFSQNPSPTSNLVTPVTLALLEDSGWYRVNYRASSISPWGLGAGCEFCESDCLIPGDNPPRIASHARGYFCNQVLQRGCSADLYSKMACTVIDYSTIFPPGEVDPQFRYFADKPSLGGRRQLTIVQRTLHDSQIKSLKFGS